MPVVGWVYIEKANTLTNLRSHLFDKTFANTCNTSTPLTIHPISQPSYACIEYTRLIHPISNILLLKGSKRNKTDKTDDHPPNQMPATLKLAKLPTASPPTRHILMNPPAASLCPSSTHSPAAIILLAPNQPFVNPKGNCTANK